MQAALGCFPHSRATAQTEQWPSFPGAKEPLASADFGAEAAKNLQLKTSHPKLMHI